MTKRLGKAVHGKRVYVLVLCIAVLLAIGVLWWMHSRAGPSPDARGVPTVAAAGEARTPVQAGWWSGVMRLLPGRGNQTRTDKQVGSGEAEESIEVCGYGRMDRAAFFAGILTGIQIESARRIDEAAVQLLAMPSERTRAVGHASAIVAALMRAQAEQAVSAVPCDVANGCVPPDPPPLGRDAQAHIAALSELALRSNDPDVAATAVQICSLYQVSGCTPGLAQRWLILDPANAYAALLVAAGQAEGSPARLAAMRRAMELSQYTARRISFGMTLDAMALDDAHPLVRLMTAESLGMWMLSSVAPLTPSVAISGYCGKNNLDQPGRRQECDRFATTMFDQSDSMLEISIASSIGKRVGWPAERMMAARNAVETSFARSVEPFSSFACNNLPQRERYMYDLLRRGERAALEQLMASPRK